MTNPQNWQYNDRHILRAVKSDVNPVALFEAMGMRNVQIGSNGIIRAACFIHGGDNPTSFRGNLNKGRFTCYSRRCVVSGDIFDVAIAKFGGNPGVGIKFVVDFGRPWRPEEREELIRIRHVDRPEQPLPTEEMVQRFRSNDLTCWLNRRIPPPIIERFELGSGTQPPERMVMPLRDENGTIYGLQGRLIDTCWERFTRKHINYPDGMLKMEHAYGLYQALEIKRTEQENMRNPPSRDTFLIVEGPYCVLASHSAADMLEGTQHWSRELEMVGAVMGNAISRQQALLIARHFGRVIVIPDWDAEKGRYGEELVSTVRHYLTGYCSIFRVNLPPELGVKDWGELIERKMDPMKMVEILRSKRFVA